MSWGEPSRSTEAAPVCPRHPDRAAYVRCQRCGRPTCVQCQRPAAVGTQCVDCVAQTSKQGGQPRNAFGAPSTAAARKPYAGYTLIALCVLVFIGQLLAPAVTKALQYAPVYTLSWAEPPVPFEPWRMITSAFVHSPTMLFHIGFNMLALFMMARALEPAIGSLRFVLLYFISAFGGSVAVQLFAPPNVPVVGASGAIFGLFGAMFIIQRRIGADISGIAITLGINLVLSFMGTNIAWQDHLGGLVAGCIAGAIIAYTPRGRNQSLVQYFLLGVLFVVLVVISALKYSGML